MPTFQDARDGLDALLKDAKPNLSIDDIDKHLINAAKAFSRKFPRVLAIETDGDDGFEYALPAGYVEDFSTITEIIFPWDPVDQDPTRLEIKDYRIFDGPSGRVLRFVRDRPTTTQKFLTIFTAPHLADNTGNVADSIGTLDVAGSAITGPAFSASSINTDSAKDVQFFIKVTAAAGTLLDVFIQTSADNADWADVATFREISGIGDFTETLSADKVSKFVRLRYVTTGGSFTLKAIVVQEIAAGNFTIIDSHLDAYLYLAANIGALSLANFYSQLIDSQLDGETTDYEGKATFWATNAEKWEEKWEEERDSIKPPKGVTAFAQPEWDLMGTGGWRYLTHDERHR